MDESVRVERCGPVMTVILDRPAVRNAVDGATAQALAAAFLAFERDEAAAVAVLWGAGGSFCAGADLKAFAAGGSNPLVAPRAGEGNDPLRTDAPMGPTRMRLSKPVIAAVEGHAVAGGLELACWCDLRVAAEDAVFGVFCRRWGVPLIDGGTVRLPRLIGHGRAMDMILTGRPVAASEALAMGLADRVVPAGAARAEAEALARHIASFPQACLRSDRMSACEQWDLPHDRAIANEFAHGFATLGTGEAAHGAARFAAGSGRGGCLE
ncbi:crotonase/enoyl-CoA hydratase family protein [Rhodospirillum centenum]|uniref:Enoyl-CoA hydratase n=1 Tax=Rhodospirillum centenum (strain ATCC 51521 / SW) TaxID=414684 RepID=B6IMX0_RHOCS|nr:crotonase/enoyl-CoA hydratase family protein [Rhodospirillum centenum]ACI98867.1 enoyl-CoA hydratase [Rhodospirillum centenum SW]